MNKKKHILLIITLVVVSNLSAQQYQSDHVGINIGIVTAIGSKFDRLGVSVSGYYARGNLQLNAGTRFYFNFKNIGPNKQYFEAVTSLGIVYVYGNNQSDTSQFFTPIGNQTGKQNSIGYAYNYYMNNIGTSQQTGTISIQVNTFSFIAENDIFARPKLDRFRTGAFLIQYQNKNLALGLNTTLFTGQMGNKISDESYPFSHLYKNTKGGIYPTSSSGLISIQGQYVTDYFQQIQGNIGVDAEKVRHIVQNRLIHDMIFLPKKWRKDDAAHIPMLDENNEQYLFKSEQKIKRVEWYFNGFSNSGLFY